MTDQEKNIIGKLQIVKELAEKKETKQLAEIQIEYIKTVSKGKIGFEEDKKDEG